ncbi:MAG TPA: hypothetical protein VLG16_02220 [Candidatus Saccharimonadales bacterium]|nr:hypothetical protein [Candidatus Saccharimonadales bacterium]
MSIDSYFPPSPNLAVDPTSTFSLGEELDRVMSHMKQKAPRHFRELREMHSRLQLPSSDAGQLECGGWGIVDATGEQETIYHTLQQFAKQPLMPEQYELHLLVNTDKQRLRESQGTQRLEQTVDAIDQFQSDHPACPIRYTTQIYDWPQSIAAIRADLSEVSGYDLWMRGRETSLPALFVDADATYMNEGFLASTIATHRQPRPDQTTRPADIMIGKLVYDQVAELPRTSAVNQLLGAVTLALKALRDFNPLYAASGPETAVDMATYFAAGGLQRTCTLGEIKTLVTTIADARMLKTDHGNVAKVLAVENSDALLKTSSRRLVAAMAQNVTPMKAWLGEGEDDGSGAYAKMDFSQDHELRFNSPDITRAEQNAQEYFVKWTEDIMQMLARPLLPPNRYDKLQQTIYGNMRDNLSAVNLMRHAASLFRELANKRTPM